MDRDQMTAYAHALDSALDSFRRIKFSMGNTSFLKKSDVFVLKLISEMSGTKAVTSSELAKKLGVTLAAITHHTNSLESDGYVERTSSSDDRREIFLSLTGKGKKAIKKLERAHREKLSELVKYLGANDTEKLLSIIGKIADYIGKQQVKN